MGIYQNLLPQHQSNNVSLHSPKRHVMHNCNYSNDTFTGMVSIITWAQILKERQNGIPNNQPTEVVIPPNIPKPQPPKVSMKGVLQ